MPADSVSLFERARRRIPGGVNSPVRAFRAVNGDPFFVDTAQGPKIRTVEGRWLIDYVGTWGPAILGHAPQVVVDAVREAAGHGTSFGIPNPYEVEMAELIADWVPSVEKVRMVNSGTEATMSAIRLARGYTGRKLVVKFEGCYHGHVDSLLVQAGSGALTLGRPDSAGVPEELAALTVLLPFNDTAALQELFAERGDDIAAVILEPFPANAGLFLPKPEFMQHLRDLTQQYSSVLIFDEVMTGFRVARGGAQQLLGITPDLTAMGKVIGGGLPVGAFGGQAKIMDYLAPDGPVYQAGTLSGNPLAMAAGLAQLRELEARDGWNRLEAIGAMMEEGVQRVLQKIGRPLRWHRAGSMFCLFMTTQEVSNLAEAKQSDTTAFARLFHKMLEQGVYLAPSQFETGFISLAHGESEMSATAEALQKALPVALDLEGAP